MSTRYSQSFILCEYLIVKSNVWFLEGIKMKKYKEKVFEDQSEQVYALRMYGD